MNNQPKQQRLLWLAERLTGPPQLQPIPAIRGLMLLLLFVYALITFPGFLHPQRWAIVEGLFYTPLVLQGEWWRFITANLMHASPVHLASNLFGIWVFGRTLEPILGIRGMIWLFLLSGLGAMGLSFLVDMLPFLGIDHFTRTRFQGSLGASGIDYGLMGALLTLFLLARSQTHPQRFWQDLGGMLLLLGAYSALNMMDSHLNIWAHLGGFLMGVVVAVVFFRHFLATAFVEDSPIS